MVCFKSRKGIPNYLTINLILIFCFWINGAFKRFLKFLLTNWKFFQCFFSASRNNLEAPIYLIVLIQRSSSRWNWQRIWQETIQWTVKNKSEKKTWLASHISWNNRSFTSSYTKKRILILLQIQNLFCQMITVFPLNKRLISSNYHPPISATP